ncbi:hypothetical protein HK104_005838, partial [Borealophlyctis nickersoniae]
MEIHFAVPQTQNEDLETKLARLAILTDTFLDAVPEAQQPPASNAEADANANPEGDRKTLSRPLSSLVTTLSRNRNQDSSKESDANLPPADTVSPKQDLASLATTLTTIEQVLRPALTRLQYKRELRRDASISTLPEYNDYQYWRESSMMASDDWLDDYLNAEKEEGDSPAENVEEEKKEPEEPEEDEKLKRLTARIELLESLVVQEEKEEEKPVEEAPVEEQKPEEEEGERVIMVPMGDAWVRKEVYLAEKERRRREAEEARIAEEEQRRYGADAGGSGPVGPTGQYQQRNVRSDVGGAGNDMVGPRQDGRTPMSSAAYSGKQNYGMVGVDGRDQRRAPSALGHGTQQSQSATDRAGRMDGRSGQESGGSYGAGHVGSGVSRTVDAGRDGYSASNRQGAYQSQTMNDQGRSQHGSQYRTNAAGAQDPGMSAGSRQATPSGRQQGLQQGPQQGLQQNPYTHGTVLPGPSSHPNAPGAGQSSQYNQRTPGQTPQPQTPAQARLQPGPTPQRPGTSPQLGSKPAQQSSARTLVAQDSDTVADILEERPRPRPNTSGVLPQSSKDTVRPTRRDEVKSYLGSSPPPKSASASDSARGNFVTRVFRWFNLIRAIVGAVFGIMAALKAMDDPTFVKLGARGLLITSIFFIVLELLITFVKAFPQLLWIFWNTEDWDPYAKYWTVWAIVADHELLTDVLPLLVNVILKVYSYRLTEIAANKDVQNTITNTTFTFTSFDYHKHMEFILLMVFAVSLAYTLLFHIFRLWKVLTFKKKAPGLAATVAVKGVFLGWDLLTNGLLAYEVLVKDGPEFLNDRSSTQKLMLSVAIVGPIVTLITN